jgi:hypothetical protein
MNESDSGDWLSGRELCAAIDINRYYLKRVRRWLFLEPVRTFPGRGSESLYPRIAVPMIQRFRELQRETRNIDECVWSVWLEDFPVEIRNWADARLARFEELLSKFTSLDDEKLHKTISDISATTPTRTSLRRPIVNRLERREEISLLLWAAAVAAGLAPAISLYDPASASFDALKRAAGLGGSWEPPDPELGMESFSLPRMREILREASPVEMEQARGDWKVIAELVEASKSIDWHAVRKVLDVQRTSSAQAPAPVDLFLALWRNFSVRAAFLPFLIAVRRSPDHSHKLSEILAVGGYGLQQLVRWTSEKRAAEVVVPTPEP